MTRHRLAILTITIAIVGAVSAPASFGHVSHHGAHRFSFLARVVRSSKTGLLVQNKQGKRLWFPASQIARPASRTRKHHRSDHTRNAARTASAAGSTAPSVTVSIVGLQPGVTIQITETINADGSISITITLPSQPSISELSASGVVTEVDDSDFILDPGSGDDLQLNMDADALNNLNLDPCDTVNATYHQDAGVLIADTVTITGTSTTGDCAPSNDVEGTITAVTGSAVTINTDPGSVSFSVDDSSITDGFSVGDYVDVTYTQQGSGPLDATDVEYVEEQETGTVTVVNSTALTMTDSSTGQPDAFVADPSDGLEIDTDAFTGVSVGDLIDVCFHVTAQGNVADTITDPSTSGSDGGDGGDGGDSGNSGSTGSTGSTGTTGTTGTTGASGSTGNSAVTSTITITG